MKRSLWFGLLLTLLVLAPVMTAAQEKTRRHSVAPGDTWTALAWRFQTPVAELRRLNPHPNRQRQPVMGSNVLLPANAEERNGTLVRAGDGGLLATSVSHRRSPWHLALQNGMAHPYRPLLYRPLFIAGGDSPPRDLPPGFTRLELSHAPAQPGLAIGFRGETTQPLTVTARLDQRPFASFSNGQRQIGLTGTGAFFGAGEPELLIYPELETAVPPPAWTQPWRFVDREWTYNQLTLTGGAAEIDQEAIAQERARLFQIWSQVTPRPLWHTPWQLPVNDYLEFSSLYGARRSYNGGPYRTYHEGVDFSAYGGTPVYAPAAGVVVLAEQLYVRGGAVIIDHGLSVYSGYYHLSDVIAAPGQAVQPGDLIGQVGTTGLSTGNHLHWDLLVNEVWVDAAAWREQDMACWIVAGLGEPCP